MTNDKGSVCARVSASYFDAGGKAAWEPFLEPFVFALQVAQSAPADGPATLAVVVKALEPVSLLVSASLLARVRELQVDADVEARAVRSVLPATTGGAPSAALERCVHAHSLECVCVFATSLEAFVGAFVGPHAVPLSRLAAFTHACVPSLLPPAPWLTSPLPRAPSNSVGTAASSRSSPRPAGDALALPRGAEVSALSTRLAGADRSARVRNGTGVPLRVSITRRAHEAVAALADDADAGGDAAAVSLEPDAELRVDACLGAGPGAPHVSRHDVEVSLRLPGFAPVTGLSLADLATLQLPLQQLDAGAGRAEGTQGAWNSHCDSCFVFTWLLACCWGFLFCVVLAVQPPPPRPALRR
jgi:hypothetical protein